MKTYEAVTRDHLVRRMPVILRLDGKAFHTLTRKMKKPFDLDFMAAMQATALSVVKEAQNAQLAYTQSDEISILLVDYAKLDTEAWFDNNIQKLVSVSASIATATFNWEVAKLWPGTRGFFDCRAFNVPREDVANYFVWRQKDAIRNSIQSVAQANFSQKRLTGLNCDQLQELLFQEKGINWGEDLPISCKRGTCIVREPLPDAFPPHQERWMWVLDTSIPTFTQDRAYIEQFLNPDAEPAA